MSSYNTNLKKKKKNIFFCLSYKINVLELLVKYMFLIVFSSILSWSYMIICSDNKSANAWNLFWKPKIQCKTLEFLSSVRPSVKIRGTPWILKWGGLESSGRRLISLKSETKRIAFYFSSKKNKTKTLMKKKWFFFRFSKFWIFGLFLDLLVFDEFSDFFQFYFGDMLCLFGPVIFFVVSESCWMFFWFFFCLFEFVWFFSKNSWCY